MASRSLSESFGPWAVVTGASSGLGLEFARQLAAAGLSVVICARRRDRLEVLSSSLSSSHGVSVVPVCADLSQESGRRVLLSATAELSVGLLVNNAGVEVHGSFFREPVEAHVNVINVNVAAMTELAHGFGRRFVDRGKGGIIFVSSYMSMLFPWFATYSASKAFVSTLTLVLREELREKGVRVMAVEAGPVESEMSQGWREDLDIGKVGLRNLAVERCVGEALEAFVRGKARVTPGWVMKVSAWMMRWLPDTWRLAIMRVSVKRIMPESCRNYRSLS